MTNRKHFTYFPSYQLRFRSNLPVLPQDKFPENSLFYLQTPQLKLLIAAIKIKNAVNLTIFIFSCLPKQQLIATKRNYAFSTLLGSRKIYQYRTNLRHSNVSLTGFCHGQAKKPTGFVPVAQEKSFSNLPWQITAI